MDIYGTTFQIVQGYDIKQQQANIQNADSLKKNN